MVTQKFVHGMGVIDLVSVRRDPLLRWMVGLPLVLGLSARWILPLVLRRMSAALDVDLVPYYPLIMSSALVLIAPVLYGMVIGFLLLDQRDDRTLLALQVTPVPLSRYVLLKLAAPMLISVLVTPLALLCAGLVPVPPAQLALVVLSAAPLAPLVALLLPAFAQNKVQGFALTKSLSPALIAPLAGLFLPEPWRWAFGLLPTFWPLRMFQGFIAHEPDAWLNVFGAVAVEGLLLWCLWRRFDRVVHR